MKRVYVIDYSRIAPLEVELISVTTDSKGLPYATIKQNDSTRSVFEWYETLEEAFNVINSKKVETRNEYVKSMENLQEVLEFPLTHDLSKDTIARKAYGDQVEALTGIKLKDYLF